MSLFLLSINLKKKFKAFLWGHTSEQHSSHRVAWDQVCLPKDEGGLGIVSLHLRRSQCLCKLATQHFWQPNTL